MAATGISKSSGYPVALVPKPPPTSGAMTRTLWGGSPSAATSPCWTKWTTCVPFHVVSVPSRVSHCATTPRVSMGMPT